MNSDVYTGVDENIVLSAPQNNEGGAAQGVLDQYELATVGRVQDVRVEATTAVRAYHEIGQCYPMQLRPGNVTVRGTISRAYVNGAMIAMMLGEARGGRPARNRVHPAFNITLRLANPASGLTNTMTLHDVKLEAWVYTLPEDEFVMEQVGFQASTCPSWRNEMLTPEDLLTGGGVEQEVEIPARLLPGMAGDRTVRLQPLTVRDLRLITRAARQNEDLSGALMLRQSLVEPQLSVEQIGAPPAGLLQFPLREVNRISGIAACEAEVRALSFALEL